MFRPVVAIIRFLSFGSLNIILYSSRGGVSNEEISTSKPLLEHSIAILGVWLNHVIIHKKYITIHYLKQKQETRSSHPGGSRLEYIRGGHYRPKHVVYIYEYIFI